MHHKVKKKNELRPWLWLRPKLAHDLSPYILPLFSFFSRNFDKKWSPLQWRNLSFENPLGIAGGVDKSALNLSHWKKLGAGFLEVGTVTPKPQGPNSGPIISRDNRAHALWNKMGFPNPGIDKLKPRLSQFKKKGTPLFVNVAKNRWTKHHEAFLDYAHCIKKLSFCADAFVLNLSSPNTKGLREFLKVPELEVFLSSLHNEIRTYKNPLLLKLSPDMDENHLREVLNCSLSFVDGWILTNTTRSRYLSSPFPSDEGGISGKPLAKLSSKALDIAREIKNKNPEKLLVSTGGIFDHEEILDRLQRGADLVQFYSALVFSGPFFFKNQIQKLRKVQPDIDRV